MHKNKNDSYLKLIKLLVQSFVSFKILNIM